MSYRTIKRLLGETSLERKCRFLFGGGLMLLISGSFYFYYQMTKGLVDQQNADKARVLYGPILREHHQSLKISPEDQEPLKAFFEQLDQQSTDEDILRYESRVVAADASADSAKKPRDRTGFEALDRIQRGERFVTQTVKDRYVFYGGIYASKGCIECHHHAKNEPNPGDLIGMYRVDFPLQSTTNALALNNAILLATAIVTAFLAMLAAYAIVRYVIVKPVQHLKDVSDQIARGNLDLRADIRTGDEFEELSQAFNRMLRHMMTVQDELRLVNTDLDGKVDQLAQVNLQLYEMNKLKDEFLATMSHELRTPLNSILGFSEVLTGADNLNERQLRYVTNIQTSGKNLMALINDLLDLAKIESGKMELRVVEFSLAELIEHQVLALMPMADKKNIDLKSSVDPKMPSLLQDSGKLQQVLSNLLSNAVKFTPEGGRVRLTAGIAESTSIEAEESVAETPMVELIVADTGIGIPLDEQETIFEKFRQGSTIPGHRDAMTREYGGTGLGLSIVKELVLLLGGDIRLDSEFGKGSTFTVLVPSVARTQLDRRSPTDELRSTGVGSSRFNSGDLNSGDHNSADSTNSTNAANSTGVGSAGNAAASDAKRNADGIVNADSPGEPHA